MRIFWERYGEGETTALLLPTWSSRSFTILEDADPLSGAPLPGGHLRRPRKRPLRQASRRSGLPHRRVRGRRARGDGRHRAPSRASLLSVSCGALWGTILAADHPERVDGIVYVSPSAPLAPGHPERQVHSFDEKLETDEGWAKYNSHYWSRDYLELPRLLLRQVLQRAALEQADRGLAWAGHWTPPRRRWPTPLGAWGSAEPSSFRERAARVRCPTLVIHGDDDLIRPHAQGQGAREADRR